MAVKKKSQTRTEQEHAPTDIIAQTMAEGTSHPLHSKWTLYYHDPEDTRWSIDSYSRIGVFRTIEEFWHVYNQLPQHSFYLGMFFLMRGDILPTWEDEHNKGGGCWSYKISTAEVFSLWRDLSVYLVAETLSTEPFLMNGLSISPKKGFAIVKLWNRDRTKKDTSFITSQVDLDHTQSLYTAFMAK